MLVPSPSGGKSIDPGWASEIDGVESAEELLEVLAPHGPRSVTDLYALLREGHLTTCPRRGTDTCPALDASGASRLERALAGLPALAEAELSSGELDREREAFLRLGAIEALGRLGAERSVARILALVGGRPFVPGAGPVLRRSLARVLHGDERSFASLEHAFDSVDPDLQAVLVQAVGDSDSRRGLELLARLLGRVPPHDGLVMAQLARLSSAHGLRADSSVARRVRPYLDADGAALRRDAAIAAGRLGDVEAVPELTALLGDPRVEPSAHWALQEISGRNLRPDPERWSAWYAEEMAWWNGELPALRAQLASSRTAEVVAAVRELSRRSLFRREIARELEGLLTSREESVLRMTCSALSTLEARGSAPALVQLLDHPLEIVRHDAWRALVGLTGLDLPLDRAAWSRVLSPRR